MIQTGKANFGEGISAETDLSLGDIPEVAHFNEDKRPGQELSPKKVVLFCQENDKPPLTCPSHVPYIRHINHKAWFRRKYIRPRSYSYPMSKILHPLPRLVEVDETMNLDDLSLEPRIPRVHEFHWADEKLSQGWLHRINSIKSTLASKNATSSEENHHKVALSATSDGASNRKQIRFNGSKKATLTNLTPKLKEKIDRDTSSNSETPCCENFQRRKPDSTYITLISGLTHDVTVDAKSTGACVKSKTADTKLKGKEANCQNFKCTLLNGLVHCKLLCLCPVNVPLQRSNSLEYIQKISSLGC